MNTKKIMPEFMINLIAKKRTQRNLIGQGVETDTTKKMDNGILLTVHPASYSYLNISVHIF